MQANRRATQFAGVLKREISIIIDRKVQDPDKGYVTVSMVKVSPDLKIASVYYTVLGDEEQKKKSAAVLKRSAGFIRNELKPSIKSRWLPEVRFFYDDTVDQAEKINKLIHKIHDDSAGNKED